MCKIYTTFNAIGKILAELEDGKIIECYALLEANGCYKEIIEDIHPDGIGYYETSIEQEIYKDTIDVKFKDEYGINRDDIDFQKKDIKKIIKILDNIDDIEWEVNI